MKATEFGEMTQNKAITPFKVIRGNRFWYQSKARMRLPISDWYQVISYFAPFSSYGFLLVKFSL